MQRGISSKKYKKTSLTNIIIIFYLFSIINSQEYFSSLKCLYPRCLQLYNGKNLVCCKDGIYIYDSNFIELNFVKFETEITDNKEADFITISQYPNNEYVILLTKNKFFILSADGEEIFNDDIELDNAENTGLHYTLVPYKYQNQYNFIVGFINSSKFLNVKYYNINFQKKEIDLIQDYEPPVKTSQGYKASNLYNGFDCILMYSNSYQDVIACFYFENYPGDIGMFSLSLYSSNNTIIDDLCKILKVDMSPKFLKAVASPDKGKALVVFSDDSGIGYYLKYDKILMILHLK